MSDKAFPRDKHLTSIAIAYKNPDTALIADAVFPRVPVGKEQFEWVEYPIDQAFNIPDTRVGEKSKVNRVEISGTKRTSSTEDYGIEIPLSASDISQAAPGFDPKAAATERATGIVLLDREARAASMAFNAALYDAEHKDTLAGALQWSDPASDPLKVILSEFDGCLIRPNCLALGQSVWSFLSVHPKLVKAANGNDGDAGRCSKEKLAELLEIAEVVVGAAWVNTAKPGKPPVLTRAWGKSALGFYRDRTVTTAGGITFGITAQFGTRIAGAQDIDIGLRGGVAVRAGESVKEVIVAPGAAFLWSAAVA
jgi:hypothetical protein